MLSELPPGSLTNCPTKSLMYIPDDVTLMSQINIMIRWDICTCNMSTNTICDPLIEIENLRDDVNFMTHRFQSAISPNIIIIICEIVITNTYFEFRSDQGNQVYISLRFFRAGISRISQFRWEEVGFVQTIICIKLSFSISESKWNILTVVVEITSSLVSHKIHLTKYESLNRYFLFYEKYIRISDPSWYRKYIGYPVFSLQISPKSEK